MKVNDILSEIIRIPQHEYEGGKKELQSRDAGKKMFVLPGGSGLQYSVSTGAFSGERGSMLIKIWDPAVVPQPTRDHWGDDKPVKKPHLGTFVGKMSLFPKSEFPIKNSFEVGTITVDEDYRGRNIAKALYGIALNILNLTLVAGDMQTPGGRKNWVSLSKIPGVEVLGWVSINEATIDDGKIHALMGKLGAQHMGYVSNSKRGSRDHYFWYEVTTNNTSTEMEAKVKTELSKVYNSYNERFTTTTTGMFARWVE